MYKLNSTIRGDKMKVEFEKKENVDIISLIGRLDGNTAPLVKDKVIEKLNENMKLIINMKNCEYVSSAGLRVLMIIAKTLKSKGGNGVLVEMNEEVGDVMEMTGFGNIFRSFNTVGEAFEFLQKGE